VADLPSGTDQELSQHIPTRNEAVNFLGAGYVGWSCSVIEMSILVVISACSSTTVLGR
jgi:hypothetical protein